MGVGKSIAILNVFIIWAAYMLGTDIWDAAAHSRDWRDWSFIPGADYKIGEKVIHNDSKESGVWISGKDARQMDLGERDRAFFIRRYFLLIIGVAAVLIRFKAAGKADRGLS